MNEAQQNRFQRRKQRTRSQLQRAAVELILERGYDPVTIQDITDRADLGRGTFYLYFSDKEDIVWQTLLNSFNVVDKEMNALYPRFSPLTESIGYRTAFELADKDRDLYRIMLGSKGSAVLTTRIHGYFAAEIEREIRQRGAFADLDLPPEVAAQYITGALVRLIVWWIETPNDYTPEQMADMFFRAIHRTALG